MAENSENTEYFCNNCREFTAFVNYAQYNFGDPNLGVQDESWKCMACGTTVFNPPPRRV